MTQALSGDEEGLETMITHLSPGPQYEGLRKEYARYTQIAEAMELPEAAKRKFLRDNARRLYKLD